MQKIQEKRSNFITLVKKGLLTLGVKKVRALSATLCPRVGLPHQTMDNTEWFTLEGMHTPCKCVDVYDGDTITLAVPLHGNYYKFKCRLLGIDTAELRTRNLREKEIAKKTKLWLANIILNNIVEIQFGEFDKYGRVLITMHYQDVNINDRIVEVGLAYRYDGGGKRDFDDWYDPEKDQV